MKTVGDNQLQPIKDTQEKTTTLLSYINDVSVDLNEVCLHTTYFFLKDLIVDDVLAVVFLLTLLSQETGNVGVV